MPFVSAPHQIAKTVELLEVLAGAGLVVATGAVVEAAGAAALAAAGAASATAMCGLSGMCGCTTALETLPTTIAKRAEARTQPATVLKLAIRVRSRSGNIFGRCCSTPLAPSVVSDRRLSLARRNVASPGFSGVFRWFPLG